MSTQQADPLWITDPDAYIRRMRELVGDRDPRDVLAETPDTIAKVVDANAPSRLQARPYPGKWTPNEIIGHLVDVEWVYAYRMRMILCQDAPPITGYDQDTWVAAQKHNDRNPGELLEAFRSLRGLNLARWRRLGPEDLKRYGEHAERGRETLGTMLVMLAGHDLWHIDQLNRYVAALDRSAGS